MKRENGFRRIRGNTVMMHDGRVSWALDEKGWHVDVYKKSNDGMILANNELTASAFGKLYDADMIQLA